MNDLGHLDLFTPAWRLVFQSLTKERSRWQVPFYPVPRVSTLRILCILGKGLILWHVTRSFHLISFTTLRKREESEASPG